MKKVILFVIMASFLVLNVALPQASAEMADGSHSLQYQVNQPDSSSVSIANDYFLKPAKVTVKGGTATVQITLKNSAWISKFQPAGGSTVISEDKAADTRVVQFTVKNLSQPVNAAMKIDIDDIDYHHEYTVALVFDGAAAGNTVSKAEGDKTPSPTTATPTPKATPTATDEDQVPNPQTSDATPYLLILTLVASAYLLYRNKFQTKQEGQ